MSALVSHNFVLMSYEDDPSCVNKFVLTSYEVIFNFVLTSSRRCSQLKLRGSFMFQSDENDSTSDQRETSQGILLKKKSFLAGKIIFSYDL
jgi:hypothetical protein